MFPRWGTHITRDMCFPGGGRHITRDMGFQGGKQMEGLKAHDQMSLRAFH